jgi:hypothetical protein
VEELNRQQNSEPTPPAAVEKGQMVGGNTGWKATTSIVSRWDKKDVYGVQPAAWNIRNGLSWSDEKEIRKTSSKG